ncbi:helix-turn-helix domain-containing protein [Sphingomonas crocodyli]|uniref:AraC family transcriptional regulator n=1 Tax=Sphingomonas crocodyli TaxID=1979270 RepID=A0A437LZU0_9SPHN|nr:AraC family transcriptional regulator [Sphingomonas crocodyli]RVT90949.1 AraC family transcriptional regulator [Sphingomonas crocodyli]
MASLLAFGEQKFPSAGLLNSSSGRGWRGIAAELRSHPACDIPAICPDQMEITLAVRGTPNAVVERRGNGTFQRTVARTGTLWLCPIGVQEDSIRITNPLDQVMHLYLPSEQFALASEALSQPVTPEDIFYLAGVEDELVRQIGYRVVDELASESAAGSLLIEHLSLSLIAHLVGRYSAQARTHDDQRTSRGALDRRRLDRVLAFIEDNIEADMSLAQLAEVACLSRHHFVRAFGEATGLPPSRYLSRRRLERAKQLLRGSDLSLADIAFACRFSSQATFTRAFGRHAGMSPGDFRKANA